MENHKICFFNRSSIHYRQNIYRLMDQELPCDFYFGDSRPGKIEPIPDGLLEHVKRPLHNVPIGPFYWQKGALSLLKSDYTDLLTPGEPYCLSTWVIILLARLFRKNVFTWTHGAYGDEKRLKKWMTVWKIRHLKGCFLYGEYARQILTGWGVPAEKLHVVFNSLNYDAQLPLRKSLVETDFYRDHFGNGNPNLVFIGRLTTVKKLDQILLAASILKGQGTPYNVTFVGDGPAKARLTEMVGELGLEGTVWFYGACYDERQIADFLYNADLCVSPGNVGLTAMHAMSFGCPVISHNHFSKQMPEFEAIEAGKTGDFFREDDVADLAAVIARWQAFGTDRETVRQACYRVIDERYNPHVQIEIFKKVING